MKVIIAGSRTFNDYNRLCKWCDIYLQNTKDIEVVCGMAKGADLLGKKYAEEKGYEIKEFPADWDLFGKKAGHIRNAKMANYADTLIAFWDSKSTGTLNMIGIADLIGLKIKIIKY